jgi:hypothetical protein
MNGDWMVSYNLDIFDESKMATTAGIYCSIGSYEKRNKTFFLENTNMIEPKLYMVIYICNNCRWEVHVVVCFVDIDGIVNHHCLLTFFCFVDIDGIVNCLNFLL